ncbi:histidine kinase-like ATPase [Cyathus striatus]|nr:histidine kinase-like ATPase [Cyathus striatus]
MTTQNTESGSSTMSQEPRPIRRLDESLINRIAAGEIIQRPASALKELIENCLDAGATTIRVQVKDGGLKLLQIQDNGCGIRKADLPILAERFTTSKLSTFADLSHIRTYGFRGEALASMSHVAHMTVISKTKKDTCAWKATYSDGALVDPKSGKLTQPKPCAGNDGTTIIIEDLFYNTPTRLSALRNTSDEYSKILDVMTKYAAHNPKVAFVCKKAGSSSPELSTPSSSTVQQAIKLLYGNGMAKELLSANVSSSDNCMEEDENHDDPEAWTAEAYYTSPNYQAKKTTFLLFINHRLVESSRMKRALETVYQCVLPKGGSPFIYLSLEIDPRSVDVNVHPTKREVHFLNEETITERICDALQRGLAVQGQSRSFQYQVKRKNRESGVAKDKEELEKPFMSGQDFYTKKVYSQHKVRTSLQDRTLDSMFPVVNPAQLEQHEIRPESSLTTTRGRDIKESECYLTSIRTLRRRLQEGKHRLLSEILENHIFVSIVDLNKCLSLIQHSTNLYLINHHALAEELLYQLSLRQFGNFSKLKLAPSPPLKIMLEIAVNAENTSQSQLSKDEIVAKIEEILMSRREMLSEYFSLNISKSGNVESIPLLLRDYIPNLDNLPGFLMRLGPQVNWAMEMECFDTFLRELAYFYAPGPSFLLPEKRVSGDEENPKKKAEEWQIQHVLFPAMRRYLSAPKSLLDRDVVKIASLPDLYKVFERC